MTQGIAVCLQHGMPLVHVTLIHTKHQAQYLNDTWVFDTQEYKWRQIEFKDVDRKPSCVVRCLLL
jgi:hypothetical protein